MQTLKITVMVSLPNHDSNFSSAGEVLKKLKESRPDAQLSWFGKLTMTIGV